jgi:hypothetical protein
MGLDITFNKTKQLSSGKPEHNSFLAGNDIIKHYDNYKYTRIKIVPCGGRD